MHLFLLYKFNVIAIYVRTFDSDSDFGHYQSALKFNSHFYSLHLKLTLNCRNRGTVVYYFFPRLYLLKQAFRNWRGKCCLYIDGSNIAPEQN